MAVKIVAEAGVNMNGNHEIAIKLIDAAVDAGADSVKFQAFWHFPDLKHLELTKGEFKGLSRYCQKVGIEFMSTPFSKEAIDFLKELRMKTWKVPSGMATNIGFLREIRNASGVNPIILSTGMCNEREVKLAAKTLYSRGVSLTLLQCTTAYPTPYEEVNLKAMPQLVVNVPVDSMAFGLSDHTPGIEVAIAAVGLGATVIEKHITLDRNMEGPDHKASIEPAELKELVRCIRNVEKALGNPVKKPTVTELKDMDAIRERMRT